MLDLPLDSVTRAGTSQGLNCQEGSCDFLDNHCLAHLDLEGRVKLGTLGQLDLVEEELPERRPQIKARLFKREDLPNSRCRVIALGSARGGVKGGLRELDPEQALEDPLRQRLG